MTAIMAPATEALVQQAATILCQVSGVRSSDSRRTKRRASRVSGQYSTRTPSTSTQNAINLPPVSPALKPASQFWKTRVVSAMLPGVSAAILRQSCGESRLSERWNSERVKSAWLAPGNHAGILLRLHGEQLGPLLKPLGGVVGLLERVAILGDIGRLRRAFVGLGAELVDAAFNAVARGASRSMSPWASCCSGATSAASFASDASFWSTVKSSFSRSVILPASVSTWAVSCWSVSVASHSWMRAGPACARAPPYGTRDATRTTRRERKSRPHEARDREAHRGGRRQTTSGQNPVLLRRGRLPRTPTLNREGQAAACGEAGTPLC